MMPKMLSQVLLTWQVVVFLVNLRGVRFEAVCFRNYDILDYLNKLYVGGSRHSDKPKLNL